MWLKRQTKTAALAMITQRRQTHASHVDFDSFTVYMCDNSSGRSEIYRKAPQNLLEVIRLNIGL